MTPERFREIRDMLGLSAAAMAEMLRMEDGRSIRRYESGERAIPGPVSLLMDILFLLHEPKP